MELESASRYVNGLLAKAGLIRGDPIRFDDPKKEIGTERRILNLVHELVARREKETEQLETLVMTVRSLKGEDAKKELKIDRLEGRIGELEQQLASMKTQTRVAVGSQSAAEFALKTQRDESARLKLLLTQVKSKCANDIRQRDIQIARMKDKLADNARRGTGTRQLPAYMSTSYATINFTEEAIVADEAVALAQETTEELTERCRSLIDENDNLLSILKRTLKMLNSLQGLETNLGFEEEEEFEDVIGLNVANSEILASQLDEALISLKQIVNQPNYVPVEEIIIRDEEIARIKQESEKIEQEWKKAIALVDQWNRSLGGPPQGVEHNLGRLSLSGHPSEIGDRNQDFRASLGRTRSDGANLSMVTEEEEEEEEDENIVRLVEDGTNGPPTTPTPNRTAKASRQPGSEKKTVSIEKLRRSIRRRGSLTPNEMDQLLNGEVD